jgi:protein phosphatase
MALRLQFAVASDIGRHRQENQDRWLLREELQLAAVADGMGGMACGAEAAQRALDTVAALVARSVPANPAEWQRLLEDANRAVFALGLELSPKRGIGTTLTLARWKGTKLTLAHVGDSAALLWRDGVIEQLTPEHTVAAEVLSRRSAGSAERMPHGAEHMLSSCLGLPYLPQHDVRVIDLLPGDRLLLCSDGLTKPVNLQSIGETLAQAASPEDAVAKLIVLANAAGGPDNITALAGFVAR